MGGVAALASAALPDAASKAGGVAGRLAPGAAIEAAAVSRFGSVVVLSVRLSGPAAAACAIAVKVAAKAVARLAPVCAAMSSASITAVSITLAPAIRKLVSPAAARAAGSRVVRSAVGSRPSAASSAGCAAAAVWPVAAA